VVKTNLSVGLVLLIFLIMGCDGAFEPKSNYAVVPYDGILEWELKSDNPGWSGRYDHASVVFEDKLWVLGGYDPYLRGKQDNYLEDVWSSSDGVDWELMTNDAVWHGRRGHAVVAFNDALYLLGGFTVDEESGARGYSNEIFTSNDGVTWTQVSVSGSQWSSRMNHAAHVVDVNGTETLYVFGGFRNGMDYLDDLWKTTNGTNWTKVSTASLPGGRASFSSMVDGGKLYLQGGNFSGATPADSGRDDPSVSNWNRLWVFDPLNEGTGWVTTGGNTLNSRYARRAEHTLVPFEGTTYLFAGKSNASYRFSDKTDTYATWSYAAGNWSEDSQGSGFGARYSYTALVWNGSIWVLGGFSDSGAKHDVWSAVEGVL
jgi:leucine-zipper-like transcriptional regulator 1